jgi:hypothetical protein
MFKLAALILMGVLVLALIWFALVMLAAVVWLVYRVLLVLIFASSAALAVGAVGTVLAGSAGADDAATVGFFTGTSALFPALLISWRKLNPFRSEPRSSAIEPALPSKGSRASIASQIIAASPKSVEVVVPEPKGDEAVGAAWTAAALLVPELSERLSIARERCGSLLRIMGEDGAIWDDEWLKAATLIRRHIPPLVEETRRACDGADLDERQATCHKLVDQLVALGDLAQKLLERRRTSAIDAVAIRHTHIQSRLDETRWGQDNAT